MKVTVVLGVMALLSSPAWVSQGLETVRSIGENTKAIEEIREIVGGMNVLFGNAEVLEEGQTMTASVNVNSEARRWARSGRRLEIINTGDRRQMSVTVTVNGKFEAEPNVFLYMSRASGSAIGARPGEKVQVSIEAADEKRAD